MGETGAEPDAKLRTELSQKHLSWAKDRPEMDPETCLLQKLESLLEHRGGILEIGPKGLFYSVWGEQVTQASEQTTLHLSA